MLLLLALYSLKKYARIHQNPPLLKHKTELFPREWAQFRFHHQFYNDEITMVTCIPLVPDDADFLV